MEMSEAEIIKKYQGNPTEKHINILADLNGVKSYEIRRILIRAGLAEPKGPGRPKKDEKVQINQEADKTLKDEVKKESIKTAPVIEEKPLPAYLIPDEIKKLCEERLNEISVEVINLCNEVDKRSDERTVIKAFLRGEIYEKDGIHGPL